MLKTPELLTATQRAAQLKLGNFRAHDKESDAVATFDKSGKKPSYQDIAKKSLLGTPPPGNAMGSMSPLDVVDGSVSNLAITDIERYEYDPRTEPNPLYDEIKASIRANGILNSISVTKRPGASKYMVYGGGNTRLQIAKELFEEGDPRFARLTVIVKVWRGNASTIAAHLAENEQRGGISFWEKAQGVQSFKVHFEKEAGKALSAADLNRELKQSSGLNFGLRMLQNMMFAVEHLAPIGPWLKTREVNLIIRPQLSALLEVSVKIGNAPAVEKAVSDALHRCAAGLSTQRSPVNAEVQDVDSEGGLSGLDTPALIADLGSAVANALGYEASKLAAMSQALESNPRISVDTLLLVDVAPQTPTAATQQGSTGPAPSAQMPLGRMLAAASPKPQGGEQSVTNTTGRNVTPHSGSLPVLPSTQISDSSVPRSDSKSFTADLEPLFLTLGEIQQLVEISDVVFTTDQSNLAFGLYLDFPKQGVGHIGSAPIRPEMIPYRLALWKLLVSLTGQLDQRCTVDMNAEVDGEPILWRGLYSQGEVAFHKTSSELLGEPYDSINLEGLGALFSHPELGYLVTRMLSQMEQIRVNHPERQLQGFVPLFGQRAP
ncbi:ParB N-terminal domain-containing protein [Diaphorobacter sp. HDW4B]|uniref:ParB family protein n=1 Tax=Diaphorobacter sp. HDW4B TaxID=2714925 RepID=UPI00140C3A00|nr:ParB family protein [Diaphorobacter sp. HDW4B]QIL73101.1 ParB N-terminal domain-containing protein [Diaphorobacter sp. HDW4B]